MVFIDLFTLVVTLHLQGKHEVHYINQTISLE